jgi:uroporphyrinogen decarboxylase
MTKKERFTAALRREIPDRIPTFELEFQLESELFGDTFDYSLITPENLASCGAAEYDKILHRLAEHNAELFLEKLDYDCIPLCGPQNPRCEADQIEYIKIMRKLIGDSVCMWFHGDGTFSIPDGNRMYDFAYSLVDDYEGVLERASNAADSAIERNKRYADAGVDVFGLCSDYCYNSGPFVSPQTFSEIIYPYLSRIIAEIRSMGCYAIKHTDGDIMPVIDMLVDANPHALHSLDPMAGVDIKVVKERYGDRVALCGNVNCALLQTGTDEEVIDSAMYCLTYGKPNGGYIFCTSNVAFKGMPPERYKMILELWKKHRDY